MSVAAPVANCVDDWLEWQLALHDRPIELGLDRVAEVARSMALLPLPARSIVIAGTNGKGSCATLIESLLSSHGRVGTYTSPHLWRYNERIRIDGKCVDDVALCRAFAAVEAARGGVTLTFFEFGTLAALWLFREAGVEFAILEVGLGGRLDAVNIVDADVALITNIGLDHVDCLGSDRERIGFEKAGVMRACRAALCADRDMPASIAAHADAIGAPLDVIGAAFDIRTRDGLWHWRDGACERAIAVQAGTLPDNFAAALGTVLRLGIEPGPADIDRACAAQARLPGRREHVEDAVPVIYDVGHNVEAMAMLAAELVDRPVSGRTHLVLGMLADKPVEVAGARLLALADAIYPAGLDTLNPRGLSASMLSGRLGLDTPLFADPGTALEAARGASRRGDRIVVCGSFFTVAHARKTGV